MSEYDPDETLPLWNATDSMPAQAGRQVVPQAGPPSVDMPELGQEQTNAPLASLSAAQGGRAALRNSGRRFSRRTMLIGAGIGTLGIGAIGASAGFLLSRRMDQASQSLYAPDEQKIAHLLRRAGFGPSPADIGEYLTLGVQGSINRLLNYSTVPDLLNQRMGNLRLDFTNSQDVIRWFLLRMIYSNRPLEEKMTLFWHGVLTSSLRKIGGKKNFPLLVRQNNLLRTHAMGRFDDLIAAISTDPAMLWWLDGRLSTGASPNENYSRELMELFTLGIGNYTQNDVHQGALALSGWVIRGTKGVLAPRRHYSGNVTYLGETGPMGLNDVVRLVCAHPSTGAHIAFRMWSFFVYDNPSASDLQPLVDAYYSSDHSIFAMVKAMLSSPAFFSDRAYRGRVKSPVEFVTEAIRGLALDVDGRGLSNFLGGMGQVPFDPPNVSGWDGDKTSSTWMSTQAWMTRVNYVNDVAAIATGAPLRGSAASTSSSPATSAIQRLVTTWKIATVDQLVSYFVAMLLDNNLSADRRAQILDMLTSTPAGGPTITLAGGATVPTLAIRNALYLTMSMPEYHLN